MKPSRPAVKTILVMTPLDMESGRGILRGIRDYARTRPAAPWVFQVWYPHFPLDTLRHAVPPDGVIAHLHRPDWVAAVRGLERPVVNVSNTLGDILPWPRVGSDEALIGHAAADHFLERGFRHFAFFGYRGFAYSRQREKGFRDHLAAAGHGCETFAAELPGDDRSRAWALDARVLAWLRALAKPVAVFAANSIRGFELLEACRREGLRVPQKVAVLGLDNDEVLCEMAFPPLSAIRTANERIGFEAATLLDRLMAGRRPPRRPVLVPPGEVVVRQSTDVLAVHDPALEKALRCIRDQLHRSLGVAELARVAAVSRRVLERKFREVVGQSPLQEIRRLRLARAARLLAETALPVAEIAARCGFSAVQKLDDAFRREHGLAPRRYRLLHADAGADTGGKKT
ncbi:MAG: DNA-binding transcriptional regulator [Lentisphaeria bacterium]